MNTVSDKTAASEDRCLPLAMGKLEHSAGMDRFEKPNQEKGQQQKSLQNPLCPKALLYSRFLNLARNLVSRLSISRD